MIRPPALPRWAALLALVVSVEAVLAVVWLVALSETMAMLQLISGALLVGIWLPAGILVPLVLRTSLLPLPHSQLIGAGLGAATGLITGLVLFAATTAGIGLIEAFVGSFPDRPSSPWIWPLAGMIAGGLVSAVTGLFALRGGEDG